MSLAERAPAPAAPDLEPLTLTCSERFGHLPPLPVAGAPPDAEATRACNAAVKRVIDFSLAMILLVLTLPMLLLIAAIVLVADGRPIFFRQVRVGRNGVPFRIFKFRTMVVDAEERLRRDPELFDYYLSHDHKIAPELDPRMTRVGRFLRASSVDELPQLLNVLAGTMSLVGPRPVLASELANYGTLIPTVLSVRPGMTGLWQVSGRSQIAYTQRVELDLSYARSWTVSGDAAILCRTVGAVLRRTGAH